MSDAMMLSSMATVDERSQTSKSTLLKSEEQHKAAEDESMENREG